MSHSSRSYRVLGEALLVGVVSAAIFLAALAVISGLSSPRGSVGTSSKSRVESHGTMLDGARSPAAVDDSSSPGVPVLCHHYLRSKTTPRQFVKILGALFLNLPLLEDMDVWTQSATVFDAQMAYLEREGYETVDLNDVVAWRHGLRELPPKPIVITFDDGDRSVLDYAYPILKKHGFKATLFVVTSQVGQKWDRVDCLGWDELRRLQQSGVFTIQSHSHDLHRKVKTSEGTLPVFVAARLGLYDMPGAVSSGEGVYRDLRASKELIEKHLGNKVSCLSWPYGFGDAVLDSVAVAAGYSVLCTLGEGTNRRLRSKTAIEPVATTPEASGTGRFDSGRPGDPVVWRDTGDQAADRPHWAQGEVRRYTITARTSLRTFVNLLSESSRVGR